VLFGVISSKTSREHDSRHPVNALSKLAKARSADGIRVTDRDPGGSTRDEIEWYDRPGQARCNLRVDRAWTMRARCRNPYDPSQEIRVITLYGSLLVLLGCWATFTTWKTVSSPDWWIRHRTLGIVGFVFVAACLLPGTAMLLDSFEAWMLLPLGFCYVVLIPLPCYFKWANQGWIRGVRNALFLSVAVGLVAAGLGLLPLACFGL
jgi:hypothetical protein